MTQKFKILSFGEILWDMLPSGKKLGGAPANFAYHCGQMGAETRLVSRVGDDMLGDEIFENCTNMGLSTELIGRDAAAPTGTVAVELGPGGEPKYTIIENVAWDELEATHAALDFAAHADAICFGSLACRFERNRHTLRTLLDAVPSKTLRVLDLNLRKPFCDKSVIEFTLSCADVLKLNDEELVQVAGLLDLKSTSIQDRMQELMDEYRSKLVITTCGENGSYLATETEIVFTPSGKVDVIDTVGAGDSYTATAITGFLKQKPLREIADRATRAAAFVCTRHGATPKIPDDLRWE